MGGRIETITRTQKSYISTGKRNCLPGEDLSANNGIPFNRTTS